jgi:hypothetical protein
MVPAAPSNGGISVFNPLPSAETSQAPQNSTPQPNGQDNKSTVPFFNPSLFGDARSMPPAPLSNNFGMLAQPTQETVPAAASPASYFTPETAVPSVASPASLFTSASCAPTPASFAPTPTVPTPATFFTPATAAPAVSFFTPSEPSNLSNHNSSPFPEHDAFVASPSTNATNQPLSIGKTLFKSKMLLLLS